MKIIYNKKRKVVKKFILLILITFSFVINSEKQSIPKKTSNIVEAGTLQQSNWIQYKVWSLTNTRCNGCASIWYTIWRSKYKDSYGVYTYLVYFQSASLWSNGSSARTEYTNLNFYYDGKAFHTSKWGIIGYTENTQQSYTIRLYDSNPGNRFTFYFENFKLN